MRLDRENDVLSVSTMAVKYNKFNNFQMFWRIFTHHKFSSHNFILKSNLHMNDRKKYFDANPHDQKRILKS